MLALTVNGNEKITCPTTWSEVSTETFQRIMKEWEPEKPVEERSPVLLFSILTGTDYKTMLAVQDDEVESVIYQCVAFVYNESLAFEQMPALKICDRIVMVPEKLGSLSVEMMMHLRTRMKSAKKLEEQIAYACAVVFQPQIDGPDFDSDKVERIEKEILKLPIWQTYAIGFFYLSKLNRSGSFGLLNLNRLIMSLRENIRQLRSWLNVNSWSRLVTSRSSTRTQKPTVFFREWHSKKASTT